MSFDGDDRIHPATPLRQRQVEEAGYFPRSDLITAAAVSILLTTCCWQLLPDLGRGAIEWLRALLEISDEAVPDPVQAVQRVVLTGMGLVAGVCVLVWSGCLLTEFLQNRMRPGSRSGVGSYRSGIRVLAGIAAMIVAAVALWTSRQDQLVALLHGDPQTFLAAGTTVLRDGLTACSLALVLAACVDRGWASWHYQRSLRMSHQELREEQRNNERRRVR